MKVLLSDPSAGTFEFTLQLIQPSKERGQQMDIM